MSRPWDRLALGRSISVGFLMAALVRPWWLSLVATISVIVVLMVTEEIAVLRARAERLARWDLDVTQDEARRTMGMGEDR